MPLQCPSAGSKHCLWVAVYLGGTAFKQQSQIFDSSPSHLSAQPSPDVKAHLAIKHSHKTLIHPLFRLLRPLLTQLPMITQSAFDFTTQARAVRMYMCECVCVWVHVGKGERTAREVLDRGQATDTWRAKKNPSTLVFRQAGSHVHEHCGAPTGRWAVTCTQIHTDTDLPPSTRCLSVASLSLPSAVSQIPDDVLTGGLSDWRWGCVMTDLGLYQWPAHCQLAVWRLTGRLKIQTCRRSCLTPCPFTYFFFFPSF